MNMEDREHTLYLITTASGGTYIGCTKQFEKRKNNHRALANRGKPLQKVHQAIKACGGEFEMAVLRTGSKERMLRLEERAIGILKPSLNVLIGHKHPSETRAAMGLTNKGRKLSTETKRKTPESGTHRQQAYRRNKSKDKPGCNGQSERVEPLCRDESENVKRANGS